VGIGLARPLRFLETERLVLRGFTEDDVDHLYDLNGDRDVMWFLTGGEPTSREEVRGRIIRPGLRPRLPPGMTCPPSRVPSKERSSTATDKLACPSMVFMG